MMQVRLETILCKILLKRQREIFLDGQLPAQSKKNLKKKLKKKQQMMMQKVEEHLKREQQAKKDKEEADRQMVMLRLADKETSAQKQLKQVSQGSSWQLQSKPDTSSVRKADLDKLPTPVPQLQIGVSMKYVYPEFPGFVAEALDSSASSGTDSHSSLQKC